MLRGELGVDLGCEIDEPNLEELSRGKILQTHPLRASPRPTPAQHRRICENHADSKTYFISPESNLTESSDASIQEDESGFRSKLALLLSDMKVALAREHEDVVDKLRLQVKGLHIDIAKLKRADQDENSVHSLRTIEICKPRQPIVTSETQKGWSFLTHGESNLEMQHASGISTACPKRRMTKRLTDGGLRALQALSWAGHPIVRASMRSLGSVDDFVRVTCRDRAEKFSGTLAMLMGFVVFVNAVTLGLSADIEVKYWSTVEICFAVLFSLEILFRMWLIGLNRFVFGADWRWNIFETLLTIQSCVDVLLSWIDRSNPDTTSTQGDNAWPLVRIVRICRITRFLRLLKLNLFNDLLLMINGTLGGIRTLWWSTVLVACPIYVVSILLRETIGNSEEKDECTQLFSNLPTAFFTVFRCVVAGDCTTDSGRPLFVLISAEYGWGFGVLYMVLLMFMTFGLFNVIIAIYVENTVAAAKFNSMVTKRVRLKNKQWFQEQAKLLINLVWQKHCERNCPHKASEIHRLDDLHSQGREVVITRDFFEALTDDPDFGDILLNMDISDENQLDLFETLDVDDNGSIDLGELINGLCKLRGDARRSDVISMSLVLRSLSNTFRNFESFTLEKFGDYDENFNRLLYNSSELGSQE
eukprot:TRINITY_DN18182_c0_g1_i1.p1 TRINITY_DN18182_c0_g1~~TRINITY_DN18182_c0_g1_i1.p1  ORF type:complete len:646 (+),score=92.83 TRINITY_DN18182_c0_g1_i1:149-2086(+)